MRVKLVIFLILVIVFAALLSPHSAEAEELMPGRVEGTGTFFEIKDSDYLNVNLTSSEEIKILLESAPKIISLIVEAIQTSEGSAIFTIDGLEPNKTYYKYQDSYKDGVVIFSNENGSYTWTQDLNRPHHIWLQEEKGTTFISEDIVLDSDITGSVEITADNISLDCNGHKIIGTNKTGYGVYLNRRKGINLKNCKISNFNTGVYFFWTNNSNTLVGNDISENGFRGVWFHASSNNVVKNNIVNNNTTGIYIANSSKNNILMDNDISSNKNGGIYFVDDAENTFTNNNVSNNFYGIFTHNSYNNTINYNDVIGNESGIYLIVSSDNTLTGNNISNNRDRGLSIFFSAGNVLRNNLISGSKWNLNIRGINDIDTSNLVDGRPIYFLVGASDITIDSSSNAGAVYCFNCYNVTVKDLALSNNASGIYFENTKNSRIENSFISNNGIGVVFKSSANNVLTENVVNDNDHSVILFSSSDNNKIYHNNFINNIYKPQIDSSNNNFFNSDYPLGGNYWSDYNGADIKKGLNQDQPGSDGIGDVPYSFDGGQDNYPFMEESGWENSIPARNPVLIVPGIAGTELWNGDEYIWANLERMFRDVGDYFLTENLSLDENGSTINNIITGNVINELLIDIPIIGRIQVMDIFEDLSLDLQNESNYSLNEDLFFFPYDWRLDLNNTKDLLKQKIDEIKSQTGSSKVDVIAHSMGGLLVKAYIQAYGKDSIDKLIFVGTPHLGAPKAGKILLEGDNFNILWLRQERVKELALNMPSLHQLLPNQTYFNEFQGYIKPYSFLSNPSFYDYEQTKDFFINERSKNSIMFNEAEDFFSKNLDELDLLDIDAYNIAGCKSSTQAAYKMSFFGNIGLVGYSSGDGTAPFISADYLNIPEINKYYIKNGKHSELPSANGVRELILDILNNQDPSLSGNVSSNSDFCSFKGKTITWRSPVEAHIYDQFQNHTGPTENNGIEYGIPGADYEIINGQKFIFLPTDEGQEYTINGIGEDEGAFDLLISEIDNGDILNTYVYNDVPIMPGSQVNFDISENSDDAVIEYDFENLGQFYEIEADAVLSEEESDDLTPPKTQVVLTGKERKDGTFVSNVLVELEAEDNLSGVLETWYSLDGISFKKYADSFVLKRRNVYNLHYYSADRAGNNEEINVLQIKVGITQKQFEKCWQNGKCSKIFKHGKKLGLEFKDIKKEFFNEIKNAKKNKKR